MKGLAMIERGVVDWIEKDYPYCGDIDAIVRPIAISPCSSDVHNVEMGYIVQNRIIGHEGVAEVVFVGKNVKDFKPGDIVIVPAVTPNWRSIAVQQGFHQHSDGLMKGNALSSHLDGLMAEYAMVPDADMNLTWKPKEISLNAAVMISDIIAGGGDDALAHAINMVRWGGNIGNVNYFTTSSDLSIPNVFHGLDKAKEAYELMAKKPPELIKPVVICD